MTVADLVRKNSIREQRFYIWKMKFGGMGVAELRQFPLLEEVNRKLEQLVADLSRDQAMLQEV